MRFMVIVKAGNNSELGKLPSEQMFAEMGKFNEQLIKAGVMQMGDGLKPSSRGARVRFPAVGSERPVTKGPFNNTRELVAGFWIWNCKDLNEAIEWAKKCPNPMPGEDGELEIRPFYEMEDFK